MSFTNKTPNYNLPQWLGTDKPSWLVDVNGAFSAIDTAIKNAADSGSDADATAKAALETAQTAQETANGAVEQADNANTKADAANVTAGNAQTAAGTALTNANTALGLAQGAVKCYSKIDVITEDMIGPGLTFVSAAAAAINRRILFYYPGLNLMQISYVAPVIGTPTDATPNKILPDRNDYKLIKLPFSCTGSATINGCTYYIRKNEQGESIVRYSWLTIRQLTGSAWACFSDKTIVAVPSDSQVQAIMWINTNNLGTITLDGWTEIS
nr:MAG: hypothetical protein [Bacteriophage sp.]